MGVVQNLMGIYRDVKERGENAKIESVLKNYINEPMRALPEIAQIDPFKAQKLEDEYTTRATAKTAAETAAIDSRMGRLRQGLNFLRGVPQEQLGEAFARYQPLFDELQVDPGALAAVRDQALASGPDYLASLDDDAYKALMKDQFTTTVGSAGSHIFRGGKKVAEVPYGFRPVTAGSSQTGYVTEAFDPNTGQFGTPEGDVENVVNPGLPAEPASHGLGNDFLGGSMTAEELLPHFVAQESSDDYTAVNRETGALGRYQVMPDTGRALAQRLGLGWRPDMMARDDEASRNYQDAIGTAAIQEAVDAGGGDLAETFAYYYAGPDPRQRGPKTQQYVSEMMERVGAGGGAGLAPAGEPQVSRSGIRIPAAPPKKEKTTRTLSPAEATARGYPADAVVQVDSTGKETVTYKPPAANAKLDEKTRNMGSQLVESFTGLRSQAMKVLNNEVGMEAATGFFAGRLPGWAVGQDGQNFINGIKNLRQQIGLSALTSFKALSSQGASGFGNLSNAEGERLEALFGDLERTSDPEVIQSTLREIIRIADDKIVNGQRTLSGGGQGGVAEGTIIRHPQTGARKQFRNGKWEDL